MFLWNPLLLSRCWTIFVSLALSKSSLDRNWKWLEQKIYQEDGSHHLTGREKDSSITVLIDVENIRGKTGFAMTHLELLEKTSRWVHTLSNPFVDVSLIVDHGSKASDYPIEELALGVKFAGPNCKADDVIARDVTSTLMSNNKNNANVTVVVVTSDNGLMQRCRYAAASKQQKTALYIWSPLRFLDDINQIQEHYEQLQQENQIMSDNVFLVCDQLRDILLQETTQYQNDIINKNMESFLSEMSDDIQLASSLLDKEKIILENNKKQQKHKNENNRNKELRKLRRRVEQIRSKIGRKYAALSPMIRAKSIAYTKQILRNSTDISERQQLLYTQWHDTMFRNLHSSGTQYKEQTKDRIVLAEGLRQQIIQYYNKDNHL